MFGVRFPILGHNLLMPIHLATSDLEINACFPVMQQLRPHLHPEEFVSRVRRQQMGGYQLVFLGGESIEEQVKAVAGFRISECLAFGKFLYVDDLVTAESDRSQGYGEQLFTWLVAYAKEQSCAEFHLDSGVQRFAAHRFYFRQRLTITSYHFAQKL
jgi:GNAT superfamily N-acetyltransferase